MSLSEQAISIVCMVRDEIDIVNEFVIHHHQLVDRLVFVDHLSQDGTLEALEYHAQNLPGVEVLHYDGEEFLKSSIVTSLVKREARAGASWILPLDADEFLSVHSRRELIDALFSDSSPIKYFVWRNLVPLAMTDVRAGDEGHWNEGLFVRLNRDSSHVKIALSGAYVRENSRLVVGRGAHRVMENPIAKPQRGSPAGVLYHLPLRSFAQAQRKIANGLERFRRTAAREASLGGHYVLLDDRMRGGLGVRGLVRGALHYGEAVPDEPVEELRVQFTPLGDSQRIAEPCLVGHQRNLTNRVPIASGLSEDQVRIVVRRGKVLVRRARLPRLSWFIFRLAIAFRLRWAKVRGFISSTVRSSPS